MMTRRRLLALLTITAALAVLPTRLFGIQLGPPVSALRAHTEDGITTFRWNAPKQPEGAVHILLGLTTAGRHVQVVLNAEARRFAVARNGPHPVTLTVRFTDADLRALSLTRSITTKTFQPRTRQRLLQVSDPTSTTLPEVPITAGGEYDPVRTMLILPAPPPPAPKPAQRVEVSEQNLCYGDGRNSAAIGGRTYFVKRNEVTGDRRMYVLGPEDPPC